MLLLWTRAKKSPADPCQVLGPLRSTLLFLTLLTTQCLLPKLSPMILGLFSIQGVGDLRTPFKINPGHHSLLMNLICKKIQRFNHRFYRDWLDKMQFDKMQFNLIILQVCLHCQVAWIKFSNKLPKLYLTLLIRMTTTLILKILEPQCLSWQDQYRVHTTNKFRFNLYNLQGQGASTSPHRINPFNFNTNHWRRPKERRHLKQVHFQQLRYKIHVYSMYLQTRRYRAIKVINNLIWMKG